LRGYVLAELLRRSGKVHVLLRVRPAQHMRVLLLLLLLNMLLLLKLLLLVLLLLDMLLLHKLLRWCLLCCADSLLLLLLWPGNLLLGCSDGLREVLNRREGLPRRLKTLLGHRLAALRAWLQLSICILLWDLAVEITRSLIRVLKVTLGELGVRRSGCLLSICVLLGVGDRLDGLALGSVGI
jgi:hypothetical protein